MFDEGFEVGGVEVCEFSAVFEAVLVGLGSDEVHGHVFDDGHVLRPRTCSEASQVVMEDDVEDPVKAVLDVPVTSYGGGEGLGVELG